MIWNIAISPGTSPSRIFSGSPAKTWVWRSSLRQADIGCKEVAQASSGVVFQAGGYSWLPPATENLAVEAPKSLPVD